MTRVKTPSRALQVDKTNFLPAQRFHVGVLEQPPPPFERGERRKIAQSGPRDGKVGPLTVTRHQNRL